MATSDSGVLSWVNPTTVDPFLQYLSPCEGLGALIFARYRELPDRCHVSEKRCYVICPRGFVYDRLRNPSRQQQDKQQSTHNWGVTITCAYY